ncbi:hypothetical protein P170DRAFT_38233 [Aspergillus steynii IBT 23096]|uniref:Uncharacterized protein n=1 Tax=Aspergillus steynii IBT 23096 TaxID=1392250 RepID=A0A2I2GR46_9EURO|nr:uncharacterized protein P170DRAFT_38233 [Aspergillus steynii IBT 23096]PLB55314.1 hypothetical protein P170DRAFT_38233 [Aspergillus steynii IBT 23096]
MMGHRFYGAFTTECLPILSITRDGLKFVQECRLDTSRHLSIIGSSLPKVLVDTRSQGLSTIFDYRFPSISI